MDRATEVLDDGISDFAVACWVALLLELDAVIWLSVLRLVGVNL